MGFDLSDVHLFTKRLMDQLHPAQFVQFLRSFQFRGGSLRRFRIRNHSKQHSSGEICISAKAADTSKRVVVRLFFKGIEEYRFQRRPGPGLVRLKDICLGSFNNLIYLNLDPFAYDGSPALIDFRASDAFIAGRTVSWEIIKRPSLPSGATPDDPSRN